MSLREGSNTKKPLSTMEKVVPRNPKYQNVKSTINTGENAAAYFKKANTQNFYGVHDAGKGFKRIRMATLAKWVESAILVISQPDFIETGESIYDLETGYTPCNPESSVAVSQSLAESEASVCGEEKGVPPMFLFGPDLQKRFQQTAEKEVERNNETQKDIREFEQSSRINTFEEAPTTLNKVQLLTTREKHQQIIERIHLLPDIKLEIFKSVEDQKAPRRISYLPIPTESKQFVVLDMRPDQNDFERQHIFGAVWLPLQELRRATNRMPEQLHYFVKFEESIVIVTGLQGAGMEEAGNALVEYGINYRNIVLLLQTLEEVKKEYPTIIVDNYH